MSNAPSKRLLLESYNDLVEPVFEETDFKNLRLYKEYVANFPTFPFAVSPEIDTACDWPLFLQLLLASLASKVDIIWKDESTEPELVIKVTVTNEAGEETEVQKFVSELFSYQIHRLFEIYCEENMQTQLFLAEDGIERPDILADRAKVLKAARFLELKYGKLKAIRALRK